MITSATKLFCSVSAAPGTFGTTVYNELFRRRGLDALYLPRRCVDAPGLVAAIRTLGISGCSISMPLKTQVLELLDELGDSARKVGAVNTIVAREGKLHGYNTDVFGARSSIGVRTGATALVYGGGGAASAVVEALRQCEFGELFNLCRRPQQTQEFSSRWQVTPLSSEQARQRRFDLVVNTTPGSREEQGELYDLLDTSSRFFDLVVDPSNTHWGRIIEDRGASLIHGLTMAKYQLQRQFEHYIGTRPSLAEVDEILDHYYRQRG